MIDTIEEQQEPHKFVVCTAPHMFPLSEHCAICDGPRDAEIHKEAAELLIDGKERTAGEIRRGIHLDLGRCICRDIRRLRGKTYGSLELPVVKRGRRWVYRLTEADVEKAREYLPREEGVA